jgi:anti-anti-sigma factor
MNATKGAALQTKIETVTQRGSRVVSVEGEIDMGNSAQLETVLRSDGSLPLVVDLTGCGFLDSHGLRALLSGARHHHSTMALVCAPENPLRRLFEIAAVNRLYRIVATRDEALRYGTRDIPRDSPELSE